MKQNKNEPLSISRVLAAHPEVAEKLNGLPHVGSRPMAKEFFPNVKKVKDAFNLYGISENLLDENLPIHPKEKVRLGMGSPAAFPPARKKMLEELGSDTLHEYPLAAGDDDARKEFVEYLASIGFKNDAPYPGTEIVTNGLARENVIFTAATTQAFDLILKLIARKNDIILMTGPNYGLFAFMPERIGARVELLPLDEKNNWLVNPNDLAKRIDILNHKYAVLHKNKKGPAPRVVAFLNMNPHNPLGKVMGKKQSHILSAIGEVCAQRGVFVIDDLVYRDLTFDRDNIAIPLSSFKGMFRNTISLFSLSKAYGLASIRAGAIVADEVIIRGLRNSIFQSLDSISTLQVAAVSGAFNNSPERQQEYDKYFSKLVPEYQYRYQLVRALVEGISCIQNENIREQIVKDVVNYAGFEKAKQLLQGIPGVHMVKGTTPEAGFFALLDFSELKGQYYYGLKINREQDLMKFLYCDNNIKFIYGQSICWPNAKQFIGRVTYALERDELIESFSKIKESVSKLRPQKHPYKNDLTTLINGGR